MAKLNCWTLWQRMPPRYQLTTKDLIEDQQEWKAVVADIPTPKPSKSNCKSRSPETPRVSFAGIAPHTSDDRLRDFVESRKQAFPMRQSVYINNLKQQQRVNSAKQQLISDPSIVSYTPSTRAQTAPQFPVTNLSNLESFDKGQNPDPRKYASRKFLAVQNVAPFNNIISKHRRKERMKHYVVNPANNATMFVDNEKLLYFKKNKLNVTQSESNASGVLSSKKEEGSYLSYLRKEYLHTTKFIPKEKPIEKPFKPKGLDKERIDYDRRVGHILEYYTKDDSNSKSGDITEDEICEAHSCQRVQSACYASNSSPIPRSSHSAKCGRLRSLLSGPSTTNQIRGTSPQNSSETFEEWHTYLKMNAQSVLHDREFLLQTADGRVLKRIGNITRSDINSCKCQMCRMEMEHSLGSRIPRLGLTESSKQMYKESNDQRLYVVEYDPCSIKPNCESVSLNHWKTMQQKDTNKNGEKANVEKERVCSPDKGSRKEAGCISITLPGVQEESKSESNSARIPDNSPRVVPVEIPVAYEEE